MKNKVEQPAELAQIAMEFMRTLTPAQVIAEGCLTLVSRYLPAPVPESVRAHAVAIVAEYVEFALRSELERIAGPRSTRAARRPLATPKSQAALRAKRRKPSRQQLL